MVAQKGAIILTTTHLGEGLYSSFIKQNSYGGSPSFCISRVVGVVGAL